MLQWQNVCSSFAIRNDNGSKVDSQIDNFRKSVNIIQYLTHFITPIFALYHHKWNFLLVVYDTKQVSNNGWSELGYKM